MRVLTATAALLLATAMPLVAQERTAGEATFIDRDGNELGTVTLTQSDGGVTIDGIVEGIPEGAHGFHVHETGTCDPADGFESAGGHFAPQGREHGFDNPNGPHAGDMENQTADASGRLTLNVTNDMIVLQEGEAGNLFDEDGSALMIHANADDYRTDPGGNSGERIACAVVVAM